MGEEVLHPVLGKQGGSRQLQSENWSSERGRSCRNHPWREGGRAVTVGVIPTRIKRQDRAPRTEPPGRAGVYECSRDE